MKTHLIALALLVAIAHPASAQDHLIPDRSAFADPDSYLLKIRHAFAPAFEHDITLRALVLRSFEKEYVVGLQIGDAGAQAFVLEASSPIWDTEVLEMYKTGEIGRTTTPDGKEIPLEQDEEYKLSRNGRPRTTAPSRPSAGQGRSRETLPTGSKHSGRSCCYRFGIPRSRGTDSMAQPTTSRPGSRGAATSAATSGRPVPNRRPDNLHGSRRPWPTLPGAAAPWKR
jgi:hypothetical protein